MWHMYSWIFNCVSPHIIIFQINNSWSVKGFQTILSFSMMLHKILDLGVVLILKLFIVLLACVDRDNIKY